MKLLSLSEKTATMGKYVCFECYGAGYKELQATIASLKAENTKLKDDCIYCELKIDKHNLQQQNEELKAKLDEMEGK